jgi:hypothetical protein
LENPELPEHTRALLASLTATRARPPPLECLNPLHLQALNYRSGTFEKVPDIRRAQADARRMMDIAPRSPEVSMHTMRYSMKDLLLTMYA